MRKFANGAEFTTIYLWIFGNTKIYLDRNSNNTIYSPFFIDLSSALPNLQFTKVHAKSAVKHLNHNNGTALNFEN